MFVSPSSLQWVNSTENIWAAEHNSETDHLLPFLIPMVRYCSSLYKAIAFYLANVSYSSSSVLQSGFLANSTNSSFKWWRRLKVDLKPTVFSCSVDKWESSSCLYSSCEIQFNPTENMTHRQVIHDWLVGWFKSHLHFLCLWEIVISVYFLLQNALIKNSLTKVNWQRQQSPVRLQMLHVVDNKGRICHVKQEMMRKTNMWHLAFFSVIGINNFFGKYAFLRFDWRLERLHFTTLLLFMCMNS